MKETSMSDINEDGSSPKRRSFIKTLVAGSATVGGAAAGLLGNIDADGNVGLSQALAQAGTPLKMAFIEWQPHTVPAAWSKGIEDVLKNQQSIQYKLLDGQNK